VYRLGTIWTLIGEEVSTAVRGADVELPWAQLVGATHDSQMAVVKRKARSGWEVMNLALPSAEAI
jgi:hypothetical protein